MHRRVLQAERGWQKRDFVGQALGASQFGAGDLVVGTGGLRKVRWSRPGKGKRGGVRVVTYQVLADGVVWLLVGYVKAKFDNLLADFLLALKKEVQHEK